MVRPARSAAYVVLSQILKLVLNVVGLVTVSRIVTPAEFGLFAMIAAVLGVGEIFRDFGLSLAAIQAESLTPRQQSNLFWLNVGIGGALAAAACAISGPVAGFYGQPDLVVPMMVVASAFVFNGASAQIRVGLIRADRFSALARADVGSQALALATAIGLALGGAGVWALAAQSVVQAGCSLILVALQLRWLPGLPNSGGPVRPLLRFGANLAGTQLLSYLGKNVDNIVIGRFWGPQALGFYTKAYTLYSMPQQQALAPFTDLVVNTLARSRHEPHSYRQRVLTVQVVANYAALAMFGMLIALAGPVVSIVLGPAWSETAVLLQILSIGGLFQVLGNVYYWVFLTEGLTALHLRITLVSQPIAIGLILAGAPFGARGVAWGATAGLFVEWLLPATWGAARSSLSSLVLLRPVVRPLLFCAGMAISAHLAPMVLGVVAFPAIVCGVLAAVLWTGLCVAIWGGVRRDLLRISGLVATALGGRVAGPIDVVPSVVDA